MKFKYTILYVEDVVATLAFYEKAFGMQTAMLHESHDYGELASGDTTLSFSSLALMEQLGKNPSRVNGNAPCFEIAFETEEVERYLEKATAAGAVLVRGVEHMPWGQTTAYVKDLNGFLVEICSPIQVQ